MTVLTLLWIAIELVLSVVIAAAAWLCFRRTQVRGFLLLGAVLAFWPWFSRLSTIACALLLPRSSLYPFSLVATGQLTMGQFMMQYSAVMGTLHAALLAVALILIARSFSKSPARIGFAVVAAPERLV